MKKTEIEWKPSIHAFTFWFSHTSDCILYFLFLLWFFAALSLTTDNTHTSVELKPGSHYRIFSPDFPLLRIRAKIFSSTSIGSSTTTNVQHPLGWCDGCHRKTAPVRSPHTSYRWREERVIEPIKWMGIITRPWLTRASGGNLARTPGLHPYSLWEVPWDF